MKNTIKLWHSFDLRAELDLRLKVLCRRLIGLPSIFDSPFEVDASE